MKLILRNLLSLRKKLRIKIFFTFLKKANNRKNKLEKFFYVKSIIYFNILILFFLVLIWEIKISHFYNFKLKKIEMSILNIFNQIDNIIYFFKFYYFLN